MNKNDLFEGLFEFEVGCAIDSNVFKFPMWNIEEMTGYKPQTSFWRDFSVTERFGEKAVKETFRDRFFKWKGQVVYLTELVLVLNWKIWQHKDTNENLARLYDSLWRQASEWAMDNLKGEDLDYYYRTTD